MKAELYINGSLISERGIFGNNFKVHKERTSNEVYYRTKVSGSITYMKDDFVALYNLDYNTECEIRIVDDGVLSIAKFFKTDCEFDVDNGICTISPTFTDIYEGVLNNFDNKENITRLGAEYNPVRMHKRAILQFYMMGDKKVTNVIGNMSYEEDAKSDLTFAKLTEDCGFETLRKWASYAITLDNRITQQERNKLEGDYYGEFTAIADGYRGDFTNGKGGTLSLWVSHDSVVLGTLSTNVTNLVVECNLKFYGDIPTIRNIHSRGETMYFYNILSRPRYALARILADTQGTYLHDRPAEDITEGNLNYLYVGMPSDVRTLVRNNVIESREVQDEPTEWGQNSQGKYFVKPSDVIGTERLFPFSRSLWSPTTYWLKSNDNIASEVDVYNAPFDCKDAYPIIGVIEKLLAKASGNANVRAESEFLLSSRLGHKVAYELTNERLFITPITNIKKTYYESPAQRGDISLQDILKMLKTMSLYWRLEMDEDTLVIRIEHISFFMNGGTYDEDSRVPIIDLEEVFSPKLNKIWGYMQNSIKWSLDKPKRLEFGWQGDCTEEFNGYPMEITDAYMRNGSKDTISGGNFISDIDYIIAQPNELSDDAMAVFFAKIDSPIIGYEVDITSVYPTWQHYVILQNPFLSFFWMEFNVLPFALSGLTYSVNDTTYTSRSLSRMMEMKVKFPIEWDSLVDNGLIKTKMGLGEIKDIDYDLTSHIATITLRLDTMATPTPSAENNG